jgi:PAS domain S-box-containing protein
MTFEFGRLILSILVLVLIALLLFHTYCRKKQAEKLQKIAEVRYLSIVEHHPMLVFTVDPEGFITNMNPKGVELLKVRKEKILSKSFFSLFTEEDRQKIEYKFHHLQNEKVRDFKVSVQIGDGKWVPMLITLVPIMVANVLDGVFVVGRDNTELRKAEIIHETNEKFFKNILSQMSEGIMLYGSNHQKVALNDNAYKMLGVTKEELPKQTISHNDIPFIGENGYPLPYENYPVRITLETGEAVKGKVLGVKRTEQTTWLSMNTKLLEQEGIPTVLVTMADITLQKEQELKLRESHALRKTLIDSMPIGMIVVDTDFKIMALNRPFCHIFNIDEPLKNLVGRKVTDYNKYFFTTEEEQVKTQAILENKKPYEDEFELNTLVLKRNYFPFYMDDVFKGHLVTFEDITKRKNLEMDIIISKEEAEKANLAKSVFLSKMSHELRTPLNGILGFSQLLELENSLTNQQQSFVKEILKGGRHLLSLINEILDLSKIESGKLQISSESIKISTLINECVNLVRPSSQDKGVPISLALNQCDVVYVQGDSLRLKQVIFNLLDNAIKYNRNNGEVLISCEQKNEAVFVHVIDKGIGIPLEEQTRIFEPFYRIGNVSIEGTGIGLSLVKQLVQLMGGTIGVTSRSNEGSDFWFSLPIIHSKVDGKAKDNEDKNVLIPKVREKKVLYIEDNPANLQLVGEILGIVEGATLLTSINGTDGVQLANEQSIDLILLDMHLPDLHGFEVFEKLKASDKTKEIPIIALSANAMLDEIHLALSKGFKEYITKPIDVTAFIKVLSKYLSI